MLALIHKLAVRTLAPLPTHAASTPRVGSCCRYADMHKVYILPYMLTFYLQTQFWDADPSTGPVDSWTIHGLW